MSSSRQYQVGKALLTDLRPNPWSPPVTEDQMFAFCQKYDNDILCYAKRHNLHGESLLRMFTTPGPNIPLLALYIMSKSLGGNMVHSNRAGQGAGSGVDIGQPQHGTQQ